MSFPIRFRTPPWLRYTRATQEEISMHSPADDLMSGESERWVRCITVSAPVAVVYRWLCQLTVAPYSFDSIDFPGRKSPRALTPGAEKLHTGQQFLIFTLTAFVENSSIAGTSRPEFNRSYGRISVAYTVTELADGNTRLRAYACVAQENSGLGIRHLLLAAGDKIMAGRQLRVLKKRSEESARIH